MSERTSDKAGASYKVIDSGDYADSFDHKQAFALDVLVGLSETRKTLSSKHFYDERGSELFRTITRLPEYYLSNCELEILENQKQQIIDTVGAEPFNLVELGAGFGRKTKILLKDLLDGGLDFNYVPIDISESAMKELVESCSELFPKLQTTGLVSEYFSGLKWLNNRHQRRNVVIFLGSSIGNFTHAEARIFLRNLWSSLNNDDLTVIGFDLKKDIELLLAAYNDSRGVTAEFNLNVLRRINEELGGEFDLSKFRHFGTYDVFSGAMESYLVSLEQQTVYIKTIGRTFEFAPWEPIHTEYSYKYLIDDIERLAAETGFCVEEHLFDSRRYFADSIWRARKEASNGKS
ncbi:MAG: L-histidine N(alpha)-methyltransferase [bacterium]|nr:L-histidine N(alpha)-methyltransferase [bacterium]